MGTSCASIEFLDAPNVCDHFQEQLIAAIGRQLKLFDAKIVQMKDRNFFLINGRFLHPVDVDTMIELALKNAKK